MTTRRYLYRHNVAALLLPAIIVLIGVTMLFVEPHFFNRLNLLNIARNFATSGLVAMAQAMVMIVGGFDLSVGSVMALGSVLGATAMVSVAAHVPDMGWPALIIGAIAALGGGAIVGLISGTIIVLFRVSPFIVTLGTASALVGGIFFVTNGVPVYGIPDLLGEMIGRGQILTLPVLLWIVLAVALLLTLLMNGTPQGRHIYAVGGSPKAAFASGIALNRLTILVYSAAGLLAALAGLMVTARIGSGQSTIGTSAAIESIAAAVIGGASLRGGSGNIIRVLFAALLLTIIGNALNLAQVDSKFQTMILGSFLIGAISIERIVEGGRDVE
jgi:ribose transport system permease protein